MGLPVAPNLIVSENFYRDLNDRTRAFYEGVKPKLPAGVVFCAHHASDYAAVFDRVDTAPRPWAGDPGLSSHGRKPAIQTPKPAAHSSDAIA